ncbi:hypothetical protein [Aromatoleum diolicum]|uniref:Uncharacterized protein n=1 Tax=Aromatoleum diolicum TaxID=75796 RepID=A0ABX1QCG6_9RHOO|nr:hypothetical protein [Aromatoleum diolicum]NMG75658.1 hypothetical protein [Aromatoleum diolicum]
MSLLSRERYLAVITPTRVSLLRGRGRGAVDALGSVACAGDSAGWTAAADALQRLLTESGVHRGELEVVLSSHFARFRLVAWSDAIGSPDELEAYARIGFEEVYGPVAAGWALRVSPESAGRPRLAAAIEQALLDRLHGLAQSAGLNLVSVQPHLMAAYNRLLPRLRRDDFLFAVAEPGRCSVLLARAGRWVSVRSSAADDSEGAVAALLERECELHGLAGEAMPPVYVHAPGRPQGAWRPVHGAAPQALAIGAPAAATSDPWLDMALAVA